MTQIVMFLFTGRIFISWTSSGSMFTYKRDIQQFLNNEASMMTVVQSYTFDAKTQHMNLNNTSKS